MRTSCVILTLLSLLVWAGCRGDGADLLREDILRLREQSPEPVRGLMLRVRPQKSLYAADEPIIMQLTIENISKEDIPVYTEMETGILVGLQVHREDQLVHATPKRNLERNSENFHLVSHYVTLQPGYYVGRPIILPAGILAPGNYTLTAAYENPFPSCLAKPDFTPEEMRLLQDGALKQGLWTGRLASNFVRFEVSKARRR